MAKVMPFFMGGLMFKIFYTDSFDKNKEESISLIKKCAKLYGIKESPDVVYNEKGKPSFSDINIRFSISHSGKIWAAVMGESCCGLDIQEIKQCRYENLADRFFTKSESEYVGQHGITGFFDIWTRREAIGKLQGEGFFMANRPELVKMDGILMDDVNIGSNKAYFYDVDLMPGFAMVWCCNKMEAKAEIIKI